jgi:Putative RNase-like toxin, toxin_1/Family of unknown function (DUF6861)
MLRAANVRQAQRVLGNRVVQRLVGPGAPAPAPGPGSMPRDTAPPGNGAGLAAATAAVAVPAPPAPEPVPPAGVPAPATPAAPEAATEPAAAAAAAHVPTPADAPGRETAAPGAPTAATAQAAASPVDVSSGAAMLASLSAVPASMLGAALASATGALPALQTREKQAAQDSIPNIDTPTGLPAAAARQTAPPTVLPPGQAKGAPAAASGKTAPPTPTPPAPGPLPGSQVSVSAAEPAAAENGGGSWWSWLVDRLRNFFGSLPTSDPNLSTSAGPRQRLSLDGDADPAQNERERLAGAQSVQAGRAHADGATSAPFRENAIAPTVQRGKLRPGYRPSPARAPARARVPEPAELPADERKKFDEQTAPWVAAQVTEQESGYRHEQAIYERAANKAHEDGARQLAEANERTRAEQVAMREAAKADVSGERQRWRDENRKIEAEFGDKAGAKRRDIDREIAQKVEATHREADATLDDAEKKAEAEKAKSEAEAAAKKREEEDKSRSWWDRVKGAVSDAFNAIRSAVTAIFDKLRQVVRGIIDAAKKAVHALIEAARSAIVGLIHAFGEFVKGLVTIALAAFPEAAAKARAWIDGRVKATTDAVNRAANALERVADAILDGIAKAIDAALDILQSALTKAIDVLEKLALLPLQAMEALAKLVEWLAKNVKFIQAALRLETDGGAVIEGLKNAVGGMIAEVPAQAHAKLQQYTGSLGDGARIVAGPAPAPAAARTTVVQRAPAPDAATPAKRRVPASQHLAGVLRHLDKGLTYLKDHWWDELKKVGWNLLWPWPAVWGDLKGIWTEIKAAFEEGYHLHVSKVIDHLLAIEQKFNSILGNLYGWFFIASVLIGAIIGAFFGGVGAIPGALAGAAVAGEVGEALVAALIATETAVIVKGVADLAIGNDTAAEDEADYDKIAGSTLTIAITLAMMLLGEIAAKLAKSIWEGVAGVLRGERAPEVKVEAEPGKPLDTPEARGEVSEIIDGEQVVAHEPTPDGHDVKITEDGRCLICTTCEEIEVRYKEELKGESDEIKNIREDLDNAKQMLNGDEKAQAIEKLKERLDDVRRKTRSIETLEVKAAALDQEKQAVWTSLENLEKALDRNEVRELGTDPEIKRRINKLRGETGELERKWENEWRDVEKTVTDARDPAVAGEPETAEVSAKEIDAWRDKLEDNRAQAERIRRDVENIVKENTVPEAPARTIEPDVPIVRQLEGMGQLRDLRTNPNLKTGAFNLEDLLAKTPRELDAMVDAGTLDPATRRTIMKAFEGRELGGSSIR